MANSPQAGIRHSGRWSVAGLLGTSMIVSLLIIALPAFAVTDAERMNDMQRQIDTLQKEISQMSSGMERHSVSGDGIPLHGFMDVGFTTNTQGDPVANPKEFYVGSLSLYLAPQFGDNVKALVEPNFEAGPDGEFIIDMERLQIGYTFSDAATLWGGRFHTPYGYWNTAFHHGAQMQTSVLRPRFLDFEDKGGILPAHTVGLWSTGKFKTSKGRLTYDAFVGNGPKIIDAGSPATQTFILEPNNSGDNDHSAMVGLNGGYEFSGSLNGLRLSVHGMTGDIDTETPTMIYVTGLNVTGGAAVYITNDWEVMSEYYHFNNKDKSGTTGTHSSWAGYMQVGVNYNDLTPYFRLEKALLDQEDIYFSTQASGQSYSRQVLGVRYNLNPNAALKLEFLNSDFLPDPARAALAYRSVFLQYAIGF